MDSIWYMAEGGNFDVLKFKAKRAVRIHGHGVFGPVTSKAQDGWSMNLKYKVGND